MRKVLVLIVAMLPVLALADAPVSSVSASNHSAVTSSVLQQQAENLIQMNLPQQIAQLSQSVQDLRGMVEMQGHEIQALQTAVQSLTGKTLPSLSSEQVSSDTAALNTPTSTNESVDEGLSSSISQMMSPALSHNEEQQMVAANKAAASSSAAAPSQTANAGDSTKASAPASKEAQLYEAAKAQIDSKNYSAAIKGMNAYLSQYPAGQYAANAYYWLGELYMISGDNQKANDAFTTVVSNYPKSGKVQDAMLKLGMLAMSNQDYVSAKKTFNTLIKQYPDTPAARVASKQLDQLAQAGY
ncbi:MAG: tol-pal system protein YbgF [Gammaproteobacteria bacterium CG11_big_fil_rev_8_21_14_0_20_46_22]|nr:MAG: tol-pal system protein YbgF [Gammaproteobacteria bacterium CG12_big_fil_rev_8_21_14_0_65_46_12]PIR11912.1 MAG: tol-pal system protein YbgF [Gammaproteobacteria bacterium CG11_big_fil_rev_8_21_14_0_20_46_22]